MQFANASLQSVFVITSLLTLSSNTGNNFVTTVQTIGTYSALARNDLNETRRVSRETRLVLRETRRVSREARRVSREGDNLHLSGTVGVGGPNTVFP